MQGFSLCLCKCARSLTRLVLYADKAGAVWSKLSSSNCLLCYADLVQNAHVQIYELIYYLVAGFCGTECKLRFLVPFCQPSSSYEKLEAIYYKNLEERYRYHHNGLWNESDLIHSVLGANEISLRNVNGPFLDFDIDVLTTLEVIAFKTFRSLINGFSIEF